MEEAGETLLLVDSIRRLPGASLGKPADPRQIEHFEALVGAQLPASHRALLRRANGLLANWGYDRILGVGTAMEHVGPWNEPDTWKFAWPHPLDDFLCVAESGWGDQYAYRISDLRQGVQAIHRLDRHLMKPAREPVADEFDMFMRAFHRAAHEPDAHVAEARRQVGDLAMHEHVVFSPSPLIVGVDRASRLTKMSARFAMIANGDLARQLLDPANAERAVGGFEMYRDDRGRPRIRVRWA